MKRSAAFSRLASFAACLMALTALHLGAPAAQAAQANLSWTAPTTYTDGSALSSLGGFKVYWGTTSGSLTQNVDVGKVTSYSMGNLTDSTTYYFAVLAYDTTGGTSALSNQVKFTTPTPPPPAAVYTLSASAGTGGTITPSGSVVVSQGGSQTFGVAAGTGYKIAGVTVDGSSVGAISSYTFSSVAANHTISATFSASSTTGTGSGSGTTSGTTYSTIPHAGWTLKYADSQELTGQNGSATNAFDGSNATIWHTQWYGANPACPHEIQINLGKPFILNGFSYLPRQDGSTNGTIAKYEFYVSTDGVNWSTPVASGTFASNTTLKQVSFAATTGQYIRLRALSEINGNPWTSAAEINVTGAAAPVSANIPHTSWSLKYADSQELTGQNGAATNAFDGNNSTIWHTQWYGANPPCPHEIQINLGKSYTITNFSYLPRQDGSTNGTIGKYEFYVSSDGVNWGTPVASGTFAANTLLKQAATALKSGQYIRLRALSEINGNPWTSAAEINVSGY